MATKKTSQRANQKAPAHATVRFYCQGIGDSHLLRFQKADGKDFWMLIDCGVHTSIKGGNRTVDAIVADIASVTDRLDVVVGTHEHWDHLSGFWTAREAFKDIAVGEVWLGWTENPDDAQAQELDKFKGKALAALQGAQDKLAKSEAKHLAAVREGVNGLLGFHFGLEGQKVRSSRDALVAMATKKVRYLAPSKRPLTIPGLPNLRVYVMGPPRDESYISIRERKSEMYGLGAAMGRAESLLAAMQAEEGVMQDSSAPFEPNMGIELEALLGGSVDPNDDAAGSAHALLQSFYLKDSSRRIDYEWLSASAELALQLDDRTNNTSLVLAFEFVDTGRVMLFTADAQVGNWLSWQDLTWSLDGTRVTGSDLLGRTVLLKVGHHGSENATLRDKGLEMMGDPDLSAFIPTNKQDAVKVKWGEMPFEPILEALESRAGKRVLRADDPWAQQTTGARVPFRTPSGSVKAMRRSKAKGLWLEVDIS